MPAVAPGGPLSPQDTAFCNGHPSTHHGFVVHASSFSYLLFVTLCVLFRSFSQFSLCIIILYIILYIILLYYFYINIIYYIIILFLYLYYILYYYIIFSLRRTNSFPDSIGTFFATLSSSVVFVKWLPPRLSPPPHLY